MSRRQLLIATRNPGKQREIQVILSELPFQIVFPDDIGLRERSNEELIERGETFESNARHKAEYFARLSQLPTAADDSGLEVFVLGGLPGVRSRRFAMADAAPEVQDAANNEELLRRLAGLSPEKRKARYRCVVSYLASPDAAAINFEGTCTGRILETPSGTGGFGYDPLFRSDDLEMSFGDADPAAKHRVSHRGRAFREFGEWLKEGSSIR